MIDGHPHQITENLHEALEVLLSRQVQYLWVDALCIDQNDPDEKGAQVQRMATIFQEAYKVIAWLGPANADTSTTFGSLKSLAALQSNSHPWWEPFLEEFIAPPYNTPHLAINDALWDVLHREYWSRLWVVQEIAVATQLELLCGVYSLEGRVFELLFSSHDWAHIRMNTDKKWAVDSFDLFERLVNIWSIRAIVRQRKPVDLLNLLFSLRRCRTTEILDRVYAISGLAYDQRTFIAEADYTLQKSELDFMMTRRLIQSTASLDLLLLSAGDESLDHSSARNSWHCAFSAIDVRSKEFPQSVQATIDYINGNTRILRCGVHGPTWGTTEPPLTEDAPFLISDSMLTVKGVKLGTTHTTLQSSTRSSISSKAPLNFDLLTSLCRVLLMNSTFHDDGDCARRLSKQLLLRLRKVIDGRSIRELHGMNAAERFMYDFFRRSEWEEYFAALDSPHQHLAEEQLAAVHLGPYQYGDAKVHRHAIESAKLFRAEYNGRSFAMNAQSIGFAAQSCRSVGSEDQDEVWLLNRCSLPVILRPIFPAYAQYKLMNYAIVDTAVVNCKRCSVMDGEAWQMARSEDFQDVEIV